MRLSLIALLITLPGIAAAHTMHHPTVFHAITLETALNTEGNMLWDADGWIGTDYNKLWLKSEGEEDQAEFWGLYSRNAAEFWDVQLGLRQDIEPRGTTYLVAGFQGLAPFFIETEAHIFISDDGDVTARLRQEHDMLLTQRLILQPYYELNISAQDIPELDTSSGLSQGEFGLQTRYEITRKFAPFMDLRYERTFGEAEHDEALITSLGLRLMF